MDGGVCKLSILIPTLTDRLPMLERLLARLLPQKVDGVEIIVNSDCGAMTIGEKRNKLMAEAAGEYVCFIDDDDMVAENYVAMILKAMEFKPDCIGFWVHRYVNGAMESRACHSLRYHRYGTTSGDDWIYERTPNHLNPILRSIAIQVPFKSKNHGEDTDYSQRIYPLLHAEVFIDRPLYDYLYIDLDNRHETTNESRKTESPEEWFTRQQQEGEQE